MLDALAYPFFQRALAAGLLASVACGVVGSYVVVKRMASISGGLSHAAFGGVGLGYLLGFPPMAGAAAFALLSGVGISIAYDRMRESLDTLIAMVWSVGMALGILFVSLAPGYAPDLMSYLFGSILFVPASYVVLLAVLDLVILVVVLLLFKELRAVVFDEEYARVVGVPARGLFHLLLALVALSVVTLIRVVGVILVIALLTLPAVTARQWCDSLGRMMVLACVLGAACTTGGLFLAYGLSEAGYNVPTGPLIIVLGAGVYGLSTLLRMLSGRRRPPAAA
jgi:zinc transport system permease protein